MYNRSCKYLREEKIFIVKAAWLQKGQSEDHTIVHLINQIYESFKNDNYTMELFINLSKAFHTVDHSILLKKPRNVRCQIPQMLLGFPVT